jgi:hypothetical protein
MPSQLILIFVVISICIIFSPIYLQRRKLWRMADDDLKRIDYDEWKKQKRSNAYAKLISRVIWGLFILSGFVLKYKEVLALGFSWTTILVFILGISFIVWGILGFRWEVNKVSEIK